MYERNQIEQTPPLVRGGGGLKSIMICSLPQDQNEFVFKMQLYNEESFVVDVELLPTAQLAQ